MNLFRREIKFQISESLAREIKDYLITYCEMDHYSKIEPDGQYIINSLYLDSPSMFLLEQKRNDRVKRFSMRIRTYGDCPKFPAFIEKKKRVDGFIHKTRVPVRSDQDLFALKNSISPEMTGVSAINQQRFESAIYDILSLGLQPKIMTRYRRNAWFGRFDTYSRVTFDRNLVCYSEQDYNIFPSTSRFRNYDHCDQFESRDGNVVLELKCESKIPLWMSLLIQKFRLKQLQFSKYDSSWTYLTTETEFVSQSL